MHKTTILCQFGLFFVTSILTHISINSQPFLVGIVSWCCYEDLLKPYRKINIVGIDELTGLDFVADAGFIDTEKGPVLGIFHEYDHAGKGRSVHAAQLTEFLAKQDGLSLTLMDQGQINNPKCSP